MMFILETIKHLCMIKPLQLKAIRKGRIKVTIKKINETTKRVRLSVSTVSQYACTTPNATYHSDKILKM